MSWRIVPLAMLIVALAHFNRLSISVAGAEQIIQPHFISETEMGLVYSSFLFLYTLAMIPGGWFTDRFGPRAAWMVLCFGSAVGVVLTGLVGLAFTQAIPLLFGLLIVRSLMGITNAPLHPTGARLVANWVPPDGVALANGLLNGAACIGLASTYVVFGKLIDLFGWPWAFVASSGATLLIALVWTLAASNYPPGIEQPVLPALGEARKTWFRKTDVQANRAGLSETLPIEENSPVARLPPASLSPEPAGLLTLLCNPSLLCLTLSYGTVGYFEYLFFYWAQFYFEKVLEEPKLVSRWKSTLLTLSMGVGMVVGGWLADRAVARFGARRGLAFVPVVGLLLGAAATASGAVTSDPAMILVSFAVAMAAVGSVEGSYWTASVRIGGARGGTAAAILNTGGNAVGLLAPVVSPAVAEHFGWKAGLELASVICVTGAVLWWWITPTEAVPRARSFSDKKETVHD